MREWADSTDLQDSLAAARVRHCRHGGESVRAVSGDSTDESRLRAIVQERQITESALLKRLVENALLPALGVTAEIVTQPVAQVGPWREAIRSAATRRSPPAA